MTDILHQKKLPPFDEVRGDRDRYPEITKLLQNIQGNILRFHGRSYAAHILIRFNSDERHLADVLYWLARSNESFTTAWDQENAQPFKMIGVTKAGLETLGIKPENQPGDEKFQDPTRRFQRGFPTEGEGNTRYRDEPRAEHIPQIYREDIHAMVLIASDNEADISGDGWQHASDPSAEVPLGPIDTRPVGQGGEIMATEYGHQLWNKYENGFPVHGTPIAGKQPADDYVQVEWFNFRDGLSNPRFFDFDPADPRSTGADGTDWEIFAKPALVLTDDEANGSYQGSYMAYWKLEQRVDKFIRERDSGAQYLAQILFDTFTPSDDQIEHALGMIVGRKRDGTPIHLANSTWDPVNNDFRYDKGNHADEAGRVCPFHAHIRRTNPRGEINEDSFVGPEDDPRRSDPSRRGWLIARRGIPYSVPFGEGDNEKGLLFMSFQSTLDNFELVVKSADHPNFIRRPDNEPDERRKGADPLIGRPEDQSYGVNHRWPVPETQAEIREWGINDYVWFKGGEYFYVPSIPELATLYERSGLKGLVVGKLNANV